MVVALDAVALLLVAASGPLAYRWLEQTHVGPPIVQVGQSPQHGSPSGSAGANHTGASLATGSPGSRTPGRSPSPIIGMATWTRTAPLPQAKWGSGSCVLPDGRVMVVGGTTGSSSNQAVATAAIFDPATGRWTVLTPMLQPRAYPMAVTMTDGSVLVAGGSRSGQPLDTAERYIPATGAWVAAGRLNLPRTEGTLTLLGDGRVLAVGGGIEGSPSWIATASAEIFDPATVMWTLTAPMSVARGRHTATLLRDGEVLVTGGATTYHGPVGSVTSTAEIYNPKSGTWHAAGRMSKPRYVHDAVLLKDGRVLVAGGWYSTSNSDPSHASADIYDPATNSWKATGPMTTSRAQFGMVPLLDGRVLAVGGADPTYKLQTSSELYDPAKGVWKATGGLALTIMWPSVQTLADGRVLIAGGDPLAGAKIAAVCEIYSPAPR